jgi:hypothetical protein
MTLAPELRTIVLLKDRIRSLESALRTIQNTYLHRELYTGDWAVAVNMYEAACEALRSTCDAEAKP